jgi:hypothetical protein
MTPSSKTDLKAAADNSSDPDHCSKHHARLAVECMLNDRQSALVAWGHLYCCGFATAAAAGGRL